MARQRKCLIAFLLAAAMSISLVAAAAEQETQLTEDEVLEMNGGDAHIFRDEDGRVYFFEGTLSEEPVKSFDDAEAVLALAKELLGGNEKMELAPWRMLTDAAGNVYYVFQQMFADETVSGGAVKLITDADGKMRGLSCSFEPDLPDEMPTDGITAEEAEAIVAEELRAQTNHEPELLPEYTEKTILPVSLVLDPYAEDDKEESRFVWCVYSLHNDDVSLPEGMMSFNTLPYYASYVTMSGEYLYSLPTLMPQDDAAVSGFDASYVFEFMEPVEFSKTVTLANGREKEIDLTLMRDKRTGMYYLGNIERRMAVADCWEMIYNNGQMVMESSRDNTDWDDNDLITLYNYIQVYDFYKSMGWIGGDGDGTPILILKDYCDENGEPVDNACYVGKYYGWQMFISSSINNLGQCLDVLGHEYTHCLTGTVMTYNAYMNDYGAINEAMSDIMGNICQHMVDPEDEDTEWLLGENAEDSAALRSMSDPNRCSQPAYVWDVYYMPAVKEPTVINDDGGVHYNSSLLNLIAYRLIAEGGMSLEEARDYWFAVDCTMVPGTDYPQLSELLPWVLKNMGMEEKYGSTLDDAIKSTKIYTSEIPEKFEDDHALITVSLPDTEEFNDGNWMLEILSIDIAKILDQTGNIIRGENGCENAIPELLDAIANESLAEEAADEAGAETDAGEAGEAGGDAGEEAAVEAEAGAAGEAGAEEREPTFWEPGLEAEKEAEAAAAEAPKTVDEWVAKYYKDIAFNNLGVAGQDGTTVRIVSRPGTTIPLLIRMEFDENSLDAKSLAAAAYVNEKWVDIGRYVKAVADLNDPEAEGRDSEELIRILKEDLGEEEAEELLRMLGIEIEDGEIVDFSFISMMLNSVTRTFDFVTNLDQMVYTIEGGREMQLSSEGLENIKIFQGDEVEVFKNTFGGLSDSQGEEDEAATEESAE